MEEEKEEPAKDEAVVSIDEPNMTENVMPTAEDDNPHQDEMVLPPDNQDMEPTPVESPKGEQQVVVDEEHAEIKPEEPQEQPKEGKYLIILMQNI